MQNPYEKLGGKKEKANWDEVTDSKLRCNECPEIVDNGRYYPDSYILRWRCSQGHKSEMFVVLND